MSEKDTLCKKLFNAIVDGDSDAAREAVEKLLNLGVDAYSIVKECMIPAMKLVGDKFAKLEIFLPEVMMAAEAFEKCMKLIEPKILAEKKSELVVGKVVIGTIQGDIHDLGKNIVALMLRAAGFEVYDLGRDVPVAEFVKKAKEVDADIIAISALLSTSLPYVKDVIKLLKELNLRDKYILMVGGGAVTREWAKEVGADGYGENADEAVKVALELIEKKRKKK
ncbi:MAG TPA: hypothetical protein EYH40_05890 [Desulfurococcales archaeon]|nr:hypothetical protein [Desulfurococcales archaeon]